MAASCRTWSHTSSHIRHPWFDTSVTKRKHASTSNPDSDAEDDYDYTRSTSTSSSSSSEGGKQKKSTSLKGGTPKKGVHALAAAGSTPRPMVGSSSSRNAARPPPAKRRRCSIENGFAHLSLDNMAPSTTAINNLGGQYSSQMDDLERPAPMELDTEMLPAEVPERGYTVEEPPAPEVTMKTSSWYEPERDRIVITDLDSFTQSDEEEEGGMKVNEALLARIRRVRQMEAEKKQSQSQALVLFRPLPLSETETERAKEAEERKKAAKEKEEDDAMDVE